MAAPVIGDDQQTKTYAYGAGIRVATISIGFLIVLFYASPEFLSDNVEWHLWSKSLPLIIPNVIIKALWWIMFIISMLGLIATCFPNAVVKIAEENIVFQNPFTRNFTIMAFDEVLEFTITNYYAFMVDRNNKKISIAKLYLSRRDYKDATSLLSQRIHGDPNTEM